MFAKLTTSLFLDLHDMQRAGVMVDTTHPEWWRFVHLLHWPMLDLYGYQQWWTGLDKAGGDNIVILPGVSLAEAEQFVDILYGRENILSISNEHYTVI